MPGVVPGIERHPAKKLEPDQNSAAATAASRTGQARGLKRLTAGPRPERAGRAINRIAVAFEAGRDGVWLARWLRAREVEAQVIHPNRTAVAREQRRAKTDRLDVALLKRSFLGWLRGEPDHCQMIAIPTLERGRTPGGRAASGKGSSVSARALSTASRACWRGSASAEFKPHLRNAAARIEMLRTPEGMPLPANTLAELHREMTRLQLIGRQIREIEETRAFGAIEAAAERGRPPDDPVADAGAPASASRRQTCLPMRPLRGRCAIGQAVARYGGLTGAPDESGSRRREKGLARAGATPGSVAV